MRYWVYINEKVDGPYEETDLVTLGGFTPDTLICSEEVASRGDQKWEKASSIFEFDEIPVNDPPAQPVPPQPAMPISQQQPNVETQALLTQLEALTNGMAGLQSKLNSMQHNLDNALEENKKLSNQVELLSQQPTEGVPPILSDEPRANTITLTRHGSSSSHAQENETPQAKDSFPQQAAPEEEEVIIRSALDSIYGEKPIQKSDTFQDLLPEKTAEQEARKQEELERTLRAIETELEFTPVQEENQTPQVQSSQEPLVSTSAVKPSVSEESAEPLPADVVNEIEKELTFMSLEKNKNTAQDSSSPEVEVKEAIITTPELEEATKDALIAELTSSPKEDVLDQIISEHKQNMASEEKQAAPTEEVALGSTAVGLAAASLVSLVDNENAKQPEKPTISIATDKENPEKLEEVLPAEQMPQDVSAQSVEQPSVTDLPSIEQTLPIEQPSAMQEGTPAIPVAAMPEELPQPQGPEQVTPQISVASVSEGDLKQSSAQAQVFATPDLSELGLDTIGGKEDVVAPNDAPIQEETPVQEQTPAQEETLEQEESPAQEEVPAVEEVPVKEETPVQEQTPSQEGTLEQEKSPVQEDASAVEEVPVKEETPVQEQALASGEIPEQNESPIQKQQVHTPGTITDKDLQDAFGNDKTDTVVSSVTVPTTADTTLPESNPNELTEIELKEGSTYLISDFVPPAQLSNNVAEIMGGQTAATKSQTTQALNTDGLPNDLTATQVSLENTIQAKRGAAFDIKTVPMVPEPDATNRLDVNELNDVNAQHGVKRAGGLAKSTKIFFIVLVGLLLLIGAYVALGWMKVLPASVNLFAQKQQTTSSQTTKELLPESQAPTPKSEVPQEPTPTEQAQDKVKNFPLPNGMSLKAFIESKHPAISPDLITWETTKDVEEDVYIVIVKVPPENPQNFKTVYRFKYNTTSGLLDPTVSDAKYLLDQAYGVQQQPPTVESATTAAPKKTATAKTAATKKTTSKKGTSRNTTGGVRKGTRKRTN